MPCSLALYAAHPHPGEPAVGRQAAWGVGGWGTREAGRGGHQARKETRPQYGGQMDTGHTKNARDKAFNKTKTKQKQRKKSTLVGVV